MRARFRDRVVVITGAGAGIGLATATAFAAEGAELHLVDLRGDRLEDARARIAAAHADLPAPTCHVVDCSAAAAMDGLAEAVYASSGRVDVLQNGVGALVAAPVEQLTCGDWQRAVDANLWSVIHGVRAFVPRMLAQGGAAQIVNIASIEGLVGYPFTAPYAATKFAVVGLSEALAAELGGRGIHVTTICPGAVRSKILEDGTLRLPGRWTARVERLLARHAAPPERIARQILRAVERRQQLVVQSPLLAQPWLMKRVSTRLYGASAALMTRLLTKWG